MNTTIKTILLTAGLGAGLSLTSCVAPYDGMTTTSVTTYRPGYSTRSLPSNYRTEVISGTKYYYHSGNYYQFRNNNYVVVDAPRSSRYYSEYSRYGDRGRQNPYQNSHQNSYQNPYQNHSQGNSHVIRELPRGYTTVNHRGQTYYRAQNRYYRRQGSGFIIVASPF